MFKYLRKLSIQDVLIDIMAWVFIISCICCVIVLVRFTRGYIISDALVVACLPAVFFPTALLMHDDSA